MIPARAVFTGSMLAVTIALAVSAMYLSVLARLMPLVALVPAAIALALQLPKDFGPEHDGTFVQAFPLEKAAMLLLAGFGLATTLLGLALAVALLLAGYFYRMAGWSLASALLTGLLAFLVIHLGAPALGVFLPEGMLAQLLVDRS